MKMTLTLVITFALAFGFGCPTMAPGGHTAVQTAVPAAALAVSRQAEAPVADAPDAGPAEANEVSLESRGPTVRLSYERRTFEPNPIESFMYFVPLISPVAVDRQTSTPNGQQVGLISYEKKVTSKSFAVHCEYQIQGGGFSRYTFDPAGMIALKIEESKKAKPDSLSNVLDYILFEGEGFGSIQIKGTIHGTTQTVTEVNLEFDGRNCKSPVLIGLYELRPKNGQYRYQNRSNQIVARVNSLTFKKGTNPRMGITVACVSKTAHGDGFFAHLKAAIANLFIKPVKVTPLGNQTLLDFGYALFERQTAFTFPKAVNLKPTVILAAQPQDKGSANRD